MSTTTAERVRIVPSAYREGHIEIEGVAPLLMHADTLLDLSDPITREFKLLAAKSSRDRTPDDEMNLAKLEWMAGIYHDDDLGPYMPGANLKEAIAQAASRFKKGATVRRSLIVLQHKLELQYDGPRDLEMLWGEGYRDVRGAVNSGIGRGRVSRCRPCFAEWGIEAEVAFDPSELSVDLIAESLEIAQMRGLGDYRPEFGLFKATWSSK